VLHVLDGVDQSPIRARPYDLHVFGMPKKALKDHIIWVGGRCQGHTSAVVPAEGIHGWCVRDVCVSACQVYF